MKKTLAIERKDLVAFCHRHHIRRLSLFGSMLKGTDHAGSDLDLLVEFEPEYVPGFIRLAGMERELSILAKGQK